MCYLENVIWLLCNPSKPIDTAIIEQWQPTPIFLPGASHGWRSLVGYNPWGHKELDTTERLHFYYRTSTLISLFLNQDFSSLWHPFLNKDFKYIRRNKKEINDNKKFLNIFKYSSKCILTYIYMNIYLQRDINILLYWYIK